ncbi:MAG: hypothetical protein R3250_11340 [Melioribacteraceae bacterium]|nr:hypothetical protein [Melioribacteraceae bacterium]
MKSKIWSLIFIGIVLTALIIYSVNNDDNIYSEENCSDTYWPCINAVADKNTIKVLNGTSSLERADGTFVYGDVFMDDIERRLDVLIVGKDEVVTLDFINKNAKNLSLYLLPVEEKEKEIHITNYTFNVPHQSGVYQYELIGEYSNGTVHHYLKIKVK